MGDYAHPSRHEEHAHVLQKRSGSRNQRAREADGLPQKEQCQAAHADDRPGERKRKKMVENLSAEFKDQQDGKRIQHDPTRTGSCDLAKPSAPRFRPEPVDWALNLPASLANLPAKLNPWLLNFC
jgi:hypothetical protein